MSTLNFDEMPTESTPSKLPIVLRTILQTVLTIAILGSAVANSYFYFKNQQTDSKLNSLQQDIAAIKDELDSPTSRSKAGGVEEISGKLDELQLDIDAVKTNISEIHTDVNRIESDVGRIKSDVSSIESDVSSIQLKIGY